MIKSWCHKGLRLFYETGSTAKINARHADRLHDILQVLDFATSVEQMNLPGLKLHKLSGNLKGFYAVNVSGNWRLTFKFEAQDVILVGYQDDH
jgi:proteic killer suppression protein